MDKFTDQINHTFKRPKTPIRIISLVPSQTELLYHLGLEEEVVGITKFCIHPKKWFENKNRVGGTKNVNFEKIKNLQPNLIIANKEENSRKEIEELQKSYSVYTSDISNLADSLKMINDIGELTNRIEKSKELTKEIEVNFKRLENVVLKTKNKKTVTYFIWNNPYMLVGENTFINDMLERLNFRNYASNNGFTKRYFEVAKETLSSKPPDYIFLSSEPYPFKEKHKQEIKTYCPTSEIIFVDGEFFSWYGSRLIKAPQYFEKLLKEI